jgi:hypothetical protein
MKRADFEQLILSELKDLKNEMRDVRTVDIPDLKTTVGTFRKEIDALETSQKWSTRLYTIIGGAITVAIAKFPGHH